MKQRLCCGAFAGKTFQQSLLYRSIERLDTENEVSGDISSVLHKDDMLGALEDGLS